MILWQYESPTTGRVIDLCTENLDELGVSGAVGVEFEVQADPVVLGHGDVVRNVRARPRTLVVPLLVKGANRSAAALDDRLELLASELSPLAGPGRLLATRADDLGQPLLDDDGATRTRAVSVIYQGGIDVQRVVSDDFGGWWQVAGLMFYAAQPFWQRARPRIVTFDNGPPLPWFPWFPVLSRGSLLGAVEVVNDGDTQTYPVWTVGEPGTSVTLRNHSTGQSLTVDTTGVTGPVRIDARPTWLGGGRSVTRADGGSLYDKLTGSLWGLPRGRNALELAVTGAQPTTSIRLEFSPLDLTP